MTGSALADALEIDLRTVRRYATRLQELGIPVEGERGRAGGYRLRPGYRMPPLMLSDDEATAVVVSLVTARWYGSVDVDAALAKIRRVLPAGLASRVEAVESVLGFTRAPAREAEPPQSAVVLALADAARRRRVMRAWYESGRTGERTRRELDPYGLIVVNGRWYLSAFDHLSGERRIFRADRLSDVRDTRRRAAPPPDGFDPAEHVATSLARVPWRYAVEVVLHGATVAEVRARVPVTVAELEADGDGVRLRARAQHLDGMARMLASIGFDFTVVEPAELRSAVAALAERLARSAAT